MSDPEHLLVIRALPVPSGMPPILNVFNPKRVRSGTRPIWNGPIRNASGLGDGSHIKEGGPIRGLGTNHVISGPKRRLEINFMAKGHCTNRQIHGHCNYLTDSAQRAKSLKISKNCIWQYRDIFGTLEEQICRMKIFKKLCYQKSIIHLEVQLARTLVNLEILWTVQLIQPVLNCNVFVEN